MIPRNSRIVAAVVAMSLLPVTVRGQEVVDLRAVELPQWTLEEDLRVGSMDGEYDAFVRPSLRVAPDGRLLVLDQGLPAVRLFYRGGAYLRQFGRRGMGPGEYTAPVSAGFIGDTVWVVDGPTKRITYFGPAGAVLADFALEAAAPDLEPDLPVEILGLDDFLVVVPPGPDRRFRGYDVGRVFYDQSIIRRGRSVSPADTVLTYTVEAGFIITKADRDGFGVVPYRPIPEFPIASYDWRRDEITEVERAGASRGDVGEFRVTIRRRSADTLADRRFRYQPMPMPAAVSDSIRADMSSRFQEPQMDHLPVALEHLTFPDFLPPVSRAPVVREDGSRWIPREALPGAAPARYLVVDAALDPLATVALPPRAMRLIGGGAIEGDHIWAVETGEWDVPYLVRYRIQR